MNDIYTMRKKYHAEWEERVKAELQRGCRRETAERCADSMLVNKYETDEDLYLSHISLG